MGIHEEVRKLVNTESARHKRLIEYVVRQLGTGRSLQAVLEDPYVINRSGAIDRRALLEEPEVIEAASDDVLDRMRAALEEAAAG
jgi:hypothetical protein